MQAFLFEVLRPILTSTPECAAIYAPGGRLLGEGDTIRLPELGDLLDRLGAEGPGFLYGGDVAGAVSDWVLERGGMLSREDLGAYEVIEREPARVTYRGREVLTNPPPSSGGILIADALGILERLDQPHDPYVIAEVIASTNRARDEEFLEGLATEGFLERFLAKQALDSVADRGPFAPRQHHARVGHGRGGGLRLGHVLERVVLGRRRPGHRRASQQHARRGRPEPARVPPPFPGRAGAEHDGPDRGAARRATGDRDRQRRIQPDPLGDPPDRARGGRRGPAGAGGCLSGAPPRGGASGGRRARDGRGRARPPGAGGLRREALERAEPVLRRRAGSGAPPRHGPPHRRRGPAPGRRRTVVE